MLIQEQCMWDIQFLIWGNNKDIRTFLYRDRTLYMSCFLLLGLERSLILQHGHVNSSVWKNNEHCEQYFCPELYLNRINLVLLVDFNLMHVPLHVCANIYYFFLIYLKKSPDVYNISEKIFLQ